MSVNRIWKGGLWRTGLQWTTGALGLLPIGLAVFSVPVFAQIVPDNTLGNESSLVTPNVNIRGLPAERIDGGAVRGSALFHSFSEFNVNNGQRVYFSNPAGIADIFSRVTGSNVSNILGTLAVDGGANLFLLNPNGMLFGPNAQLDIQGSFVASTGSGFQFSDGSEFSATNPQAPPLLTMNVTPGVQWGTQQPGATITNRGNLTVGQDLRLVGGNLDVQGQLQAGRDLTLLAQDTVTVTNNAFISTINTSITSKPQGAAGNITINTRNLIVSNGARLSTASRGDDKAGNIYINASGSVELIGTGFQDLQQNVVFPGITGFLTLDGLLRNSTGLIAAAGSNGDAGNIKLETGQLTVRDGALIFTSTFGQGKGGNIDINASQRVELISSLLGSATIGSKAAAGDIKIDTKNLVMQGGALVSTSTYGGSGQGGVVKVNASESVALGGTPAGLPTTITSASVGGTGTSGDVYITTKRLSVRDGAEISTLSGSDRLPNFIQPLGLLGGSAGNLFVSATESVEVSGQSSRLASSSFTSNPGGNISINTSQLTVQDSAEIAASASGTGKGGNITIEAGTLKLDQGEIRSQTERSQAGDIALKLNDILLLRRNSVISTTAGSAQAPGNGGNITISAPFVVAVPSENSDIIANAFSGDGGQINIIDNNRVFGLKPQNRQSFDTLRQNRTSDISASSQSGNQGIINIQSLSVDPSQGLTELPVEVIDPSRQIANRCGAGNTTSANGQGEFVVTGRGGLPPSPDDLQTSGAIAPGWVTRDGGNSRRSSAPVEPPATPSTPPLVEAQGMFINAKGEVVLTAQTPTTTPHQSGIAEPLCSPATNGHE